MSTEGIPIGGKEPQVSSQCKRLVSLIDELNETRTVLEKRLEPALMPAPEAPKAIGEGGKGGEGGDMKCILASTLQVIADGLVTHLQQVRGLIDRIEI